MGLITGPRRVSMAIKLIGSAAAAAAASSEQLDRKKAK